MCVVSVGISTCVVKNYELFKSLLLMSVFYLLFNKSVQTKNK